MDESAAKRFYVNIFICRATERNKHRDFWVMRSFARHFKLSPRSCKVKQPNATIYISESHYTTTGGLNETPIAHHIRARCERKGIYSQAMTDQISNHWRWIFLKCKESSEKVSLSSFHCSSSSCLRSRPLIKHVQPYCLCLSVSKTSHMVHSRGKKCQLSLMHPINGENGKRRMWKGHNPGGGYNPPVATGYLVYKQCTGKTLV